MERNSSARGQHMASSYAELDRIWDAWVNGDPQDDVHPQLVQYVRHLDAAVQHLGSKSASRTSRYEPTKGRPAHPPQPGPSTATTVPPSPCPPHVPSAMTRRQHTLLAQL
ncbi:hypothetical protein CLAIMM_02391 isoform 3 [Cladophialophora immunda]|nr:hypothetical protein CLAIMM_02391 isoform 3 [Cladophialophora immunda]